MYYMSVEDVSTSKATLVYRWLRAEFEEGRIASGERLPSENELCRRFDASRPSVRLATARLAHEGLVRTERGKGTFRVEPNRSSSRDVAIVLPHLTSYIYPEIVSAASRILCDRAYQTLFDCSEGDAEAELTILERLKERRPAALAISPVQRIPAREARKAERAEAERRLALLRDMRDAGTAVVLLDNTLGDESFSSIAIDDYGAGRRAAEHLLSRGFGSPAIVWWAGHAPFHERRRGFAAALAERKDGPTALRELRLGDEAGAARAAALTAFLGRLAESPAAVFCANDELALDLRAVALAEGLRVPEDLSLIGFDDSPLARLGEVSLASFAYPSRYIGERAASMLIEMIEGKASFARTSVSIEPVLVERGSVRARSTP